MDGGLSRIFGAAFGGLYLAATLHRAVPAVRDAGGSVVDPGGFTDLPCRAQLEAVTESTGVREDVVDQTERVFVLAASFEGDITADDQITVAGQRRQIVRVDRDPARTYFDLRVRRA